jgi:hypothetical protein
MKKTLAVTLLCAMACTACSTAWLATLDSILAAAAPALINILQIVAVANGRAVNAAQVAKINDDAAAIKRLASDFATASAQAAPGVCSQLQASIGVYQQDQQLVLSTAQVSDTNTQTKITVLAGLVASTTDAILAVIPSCIVRPAGLPMKAALPVSVSRFVASYNTILTAKTGKPTVDALTASQKLPQHSKAFRVVTLGMVQ